jgi:sulfite reductase (NADPH) flavoprotein alpha-component
MHQVKKLSRSKQVRCTPMIPPEDAKALSLANGDIVEVSSRPGAIQLPAEVTPSIMPTVVSIPHGFGHNKKDTRISHAEAKPGVSLNDITDYLRVDSLTGNAAFSGLPVTIKKIMNNPQGLTDSVITSGKPLLILYGSQSGNAQALANDLAKAAAADGLLAKVISMDKVDIASLSEVERLLIVVSTFGEGDMPDVAENLWQSINAETAPDLSQLCYAVLALGDSSYEHFCQAGKNWHRRLSELNAQAIQEVALCDANYVATAEQWQSLTLTEISKVGQQSPVSLDELSSISPIFKASNYSTVSYSRQHPMQATLLRKERLNKPGSSKQTYHVEFALSDTNQSYNTGDIFYLVPKNAISMVEHLLTLCQLSLSAALMATLQTEYDVRTPGEKLLLVIAEQYPNSTISECIHHQDSLDECINGKDVIDLLTEFPVVTTEDSLLSILSVLSPRAYSIASSIQQYPGQVHLTVAKVEYTREGRYYKGTGSAYLADELALGDAIDCYFAPNKHFVVPNDDSAAMIMVGPGTGIAPFRGFLQEREYRNASGNNWLFFGDRQSEYDFLYQDELLRWQEKGVLTHLDTAFSRDQQEKYYVQDKMLAQAEVFYQWLDKGAYLFVCGDALHMAKDVDLALHAIVKAQANMSNEETAQYIQRLVNEKRYVRDVY